MNTTDNPAADLPDMTGAEWGGARDDLALTHAALATLMGVKEARSVQRWEDETHDIPAGRALDMHALLADARAIEDRAVAELRGHDAPILLTYRTDEDFHAAHPTSQYTARWHRALTTRVGRRLTGARALYVTQHHKARRPLPPPAGAIDILAQWADLAPTRRLDPPDQGTQP
jgi:hypothetical protein